MRAVSTTCSDAEPVTAPSSKEPPLTIYNENSVPILYRGPDQKIGLSEGAHKTVEKAHGAAQRAIEADGVLAYDKHLLLGHSVVVHNKAPMGTDQPGQTAFAIGASTLHEALTEVIGAFDLSHVGERDQSSDSTYPPDWVASTHPELGGLLADYYSCEQRDISEVL